MGIEGGWIWQAQATTPTGSDGSYSFPESPANKRAYQVRTTLPPARHSAVLFEGVQDTSRSTPARNRRGRRHRHAQRQGLACHTGHLIYLQQLGTDGNWQTSKPALSHRLDLFVRLDVQSAGTVQLRARIFGGPQNIGGASSTVSIAVTGVHRSRRCRQAPSDDRTSVTRARDPWAEDIQELHGGPRQPTSGRGPVPSRAWKPRQGSALPAPGRWVRGLRSWDACRAR